MARISIEIDSESHADQYGFRTLDGFRTLASNNELGILSSIALTDTMFRFMKLGYGKAHKGKRDDADRTTANAKLKSLIQDDKCDVIATIGDYF